MALALLPDAASGAVYLTVHFRVKPDQVEAAEALFRKHVADGQRDAGNLLFLCVQDANDPSRFTSWEVWEDQACIDAHDATAHHAVFLKELAGLQAQEKTVLVQKLHAAGQR